MVWNTNFIWQVSHSLYYSLSMAFTSYLDSSYDVVKARISSLSPNAFLELVERIHTMTQTKTARISTTDQELRNHVLLSNMRRTTSSSSTPSNTRTSVFCAEQLIAAPFTSGQHKYAYEMLYLQWLVSTPAATPELQRAILAHSLVNKRGTSNSWFETDCLVEIHNGKMKDIFRN